eukprot:7390852-Prymnesium_polylepis.1
MRSTLRSLHTTRRRDGGSPGTSQKRRTSSLHASLAPPRRRGVVDADAGNVLAVEQPNTSLLVGNRYGSQRDVCTRRVGRALELGYRRLREGKEAPPAAAAAHAYERNVAEERRRVAIRRAAWERAGPVHAAEDHVLVDDAAHAAGRVGSRFDATSSAGRLVLGRSRLTSRRRDVGERDVRDGAVADAPDR